MEIKSINFRELRNEEHYECMKEFKGHIATIGASSLKIEPLWNEFLEKYDVEDGALKKIAKSKLTTQIERAVKVRDRNFRGISGCIKSMTNHYTSETEDAAVQLKIVLDTFGYVAGKGMAEKSGAYEQLIQELKSANNTAAVTRLGIGDWINQLAVNSSDIFNLTQQRSIEIADKPDVVVKDAREAVDAAFRAINKRIEALLEVGGDDEIELFRLYIRRLNVIIDRYNNIMAMRKGRG